MQESHRLTQIIQQQLETPSVEYKRSAEWSELRPNLIRTCLAMANIRDGGTIIIGVSQNGPEFSLSGMSGAEISTYKSDDIRAAINAYADPPIEIEWRTVEIEGRTFGALVIQEFQQFPVLCRKDGLGLEEGAFYFRSSRMPETAKVKSHFEMRDILDRAIDRGVAAFVQRVRNAGLSFGDDGESDAAKFAKQREEN